MRAIKRDIEHGSPCRECKYEDVCRRSFDCYAWRMWFIKEWRELRRIYGVVKDDSNNSK